MQNVSLQFSSQFYMFLEHLLCSTCLTKWFLKMNAKKEHLHNVLLVSSSLKSQRF